MILSHSIHINNISDVQEELCFGEDLTELTSLKSLVVNVTRSGPGCDTAVFPLSISYNKNEMESVGKQCNHHVIQHRQ